MIRNRLLGVLAVATLLMTGCGGGANSTPSTSSSPSTPQTQSAATAVILVTSGMTMNGGNGSMQAVVGHTLQLNGSSSSDKGSTIKSYQWSVASRPSGSTAALSHPTAVTASFTPDKMGDYSLDLQVTDAMGSVSKQNLAFKVTGVPPTTNVVTQVAFTNGITTQPTQQVDVGSVVTLDASGSVSASGGTLTISWVLASKPATSAVTLPASGNTVHFSPDVVGEYDVHVTATDSTGASDEVDYVYQADLPPSALVVATVSSATGLAASIQAATNYLVVLDGSSSSVAVGDGVNTVWTLVSKPAGSNAQLSALSGWRTNFTPDVAGSYLVTLTLTDTTTGISSTFTMTVQANQGPVAIISGSSTPVAVASGPSLVSSIGAPVILHGGASYEMGGATLSYQWQISSRPAGSTASLSSPNTADTAFTPDENGSYTIQLTVTDPASSAAVSTVTVQVGPYPPVAVLSQAPVSVLLGGTVTDSGALSYDPNGYPLTYSWAIDAAPAGSTAAINGATNTASLSFTPDVAGTYTISLTVNNGTTDAIAELTINAFAAGSGTVPLTYEPLMSKYNSATDKLIMISANPNALHIVDPNAATDLAVALPATVKDFSVSPDGTKAAVLHEGVVSVIDLTSATLLNSWATNGSQTFVVISNAGLIYIGGQTGGQWVTPGMTVLDAATGAVVQSYTGSAVFYGTMHAAYADASNQIFVVSDGLTPVQTYSVALSSSTGQVSGTTGSPYWGTYPMGAPMWLSSDESLLFTASGTYFKSSGMTYVSTLGLNTPILSVDDDTGTGEAVALAETAGAQFGSYTYPASYQLYTGSLLLPQGGLPLPLVAGVQSYGLAMFHSSSGKHVMVVQTGTSQPNGAAAQYFALLR
ncbi:MAG TPA: hypothetical protein VFK21_08235 [Gammaproteobacteria bacterium]|nr:hypothetical protein [Gammaproteobacteria bacterium]